jgi:hypothetical protein
MRYHRSMTGRWLAVLFLASVGLFGTWGCASRTVAPNKPEIGPGRADLRGINVFLRTFRVNGAGKVHPAALTLLQDRFLDYLESTTAMTDIYMYGEGKAEGPSLLLDVTMNLDQTTYRTYLLDLIALVPWTFGVFTPTWGYVDIDIELTASDRADLPIQSFSHTARVPFDALFFGWFRTGYVAEAYTAAYDDAFKDVAGQLAAAAPEIRRGVSRELVAANNEGSAAEQGAHLDFTIDYGERERGFGLITEPEEVLDGTVLGYLRLLGGVEVAGMAGVASVGSAVTIESGSVVVASGNAQQLGFRISLYDAPDTTGFFVYPLLGFINQLIDIGDFRSTLPLSKITKGREIAATCSDPVTHAKRVCTAPNVYRLALNSGYLGLRAGYSLVLGGEYVRLFASLSGGVNLLEYRSVGATVADWHSQADSFGALRSAAVGVTTGLAFPTVHIAVRFLADYEHYLSFTYAEPLEFRGPVAFDETLKRYYQPRLVVDQASLGAWTFQLATAFVF